MKNKDTIAPKLRFTNNGELYPFWKIVKLNKLAKRVTERNTKGLIGRVLTNSAVLGVIDQGDYFDRQIANENNLEGYYVVDLGDFVYNPRVSNGAPVGPISRNKIGKGVMSPLYTVFRFNEDANSFYEHYFKSAHWHCYLRTISNSGARHDRMSITSSDFMNMPIPLPHEDEQQKISDLLTSVDELIAEQGKKVDALKEHKKGLMQQLFPAEGETAPKLRFPEFKNAGKWEKITIREVAKNLIDGDWIESKDQSNDGIRLIQTSNIGLGEFVQKQDHARYISEGTFKRMRCSEVLPGDCIISRLPEPLGRSCLVPDIGKRMITAVDCLIVRLDHAFIDSYFFVLSCQTRNYLSEVESKSSGSTRQRISRENLSNIKIPIPSLLEQQKIANCLSSLDRLIEEQSKKLEALRLHKKGLIQQVFPSYE